MIIKSNKIKRFAPWAVASGILFFLFWRVDIGEFMLAVSSADLLTYIPLSAGFIFVWFLIESLNLRALFHHFGHLIPYREVMNLRGTTYLLMIINYSLGIGGIALYLKKMNDIPLPRAASLVLFYNYSDIVSIAAMSAAGCALSGGGADTGRLLVLSVSVFFIYVTGVIILRNLPDIRLLRRLRNSAVLELFREAGLRQFILIPLYRAVYFSTFIIFFYLALRAFYIEIPFLVLAGVVPVILFVSAIPVTPSGLGTIQAAMIFFFRPYSAEPNILAFSVVYSVSILILRMLIGMFYLKRLGRPVMDTDAAAPSVEMDS